MFRLLVSDVLWEAIGPLLPPEPPKPKGGRPRVPARAALAGIHMLWRAARRLRAARGELLQQRLAAV